MTIYGCRASVPQAAVRNNAASEKLPTYCSRQGRKSPCLPNSSSLHKCPLPVSDVTYRNHFNQFVNDLGKEAPPIFKWLVFAHAVTDHSLFMRLSASCAQPPGCLAYWAQFYFQQPIDENQQFNAQ